MKSSDGRKSSDIAMTIPLVSLGLVVGFFVAMPGCTKPGTGHWDIRLIVMNSSGADLEDVEIVFVDEHDPKSTKQRRLLGDMPAGSEQFTSVSTTDLYWLSLSFLSGEESRTFDVAGGTITTAEEYRAIIESADTVRLERVTVGGRVLEEGEAEPMETEPE